MRILLVLALAVDFSYASFCGSSAIPYSFEALPDGQPILGCARPICFGWNEKGEPATDDGGFYKISKHPDGFMRKDGMKATPFDHHDPRYFQQQTADCEPTYQSQSCAGDNQWAAGIAPLMNISAYPIVMQCCTFEPLRLSSDRGVATINPGQIVIGGEVSKNGTQYAFDYISNIAKIISLDGVVSYEVYVRRFMCLPPAEPKKPKIVSLNPVHNAEDFRRSPQHSRAFQAPNIAVNNPVQTPALQTPQGNVIEGPFGEGENVLVEEEIAQDGIEIDPTTTTQAPENELPPLEPQPNPQPPPPSQNFQPLFPQQEFVAEPIYYPPVAQPAPVAAAPAYYATSGNYYCFTGDTKVRIIDGSEKRLDELDVDDWVQTLKDAEVQYAPVSFWLHRVPSQQAEFHKIELSDGSELKLTAKHFIYKANCLETGEEVTSDELSREAVFADRVTEGDCLYRVLANDRLITERVTKVSKVKETGIYSPMTSNGKIIVNGIYASCHNIVESYSLQNTFFSYVDTFRQWYSSIFEEHTEVADLPLGMDTIVTLMDYVIPKNLVTL